MPNKFLTTIKPDRTWLNITENPHISQDMTSFKTETFPSSLTESELSSHSSNNSMFHKEFIDPALLTVPEDPTDIIQHLNDTFHTWQQYQDYVNHKMMI